NSVDVTFGRRNRKRAVFLRPLTDPLAAPEPRQLSSPHPQPDINHEDIMIEKLIASTWNRLIAPRERRPQIAPRLDLGFRIVDGEVQRARASLPESKRAEHAAIL